MNSFGKFIIRPTVIIIAYCKNNLNSGFCAGIVYAGKNGVRGANRYFIGSYILSNGALGSCENPACYAKIGCRAACSKIKSISRGSACRRINGDGGAGRIKVCLNLLNCESQILPDLGTRFFFGRTG